MTGAEAMGESTKENHLQFETACSYPTKGESANGKRERKLVAVFPRQFFLPSTTPFVKQQHLKQFPLAPDLQFPQK